MMSLPLLLVASLLVAINGQPRVNSRQTETSISNEVGLGTGNCEPTLFACKGNQLISNCGSVVATCNESNGEYCNARYGICSVCQQGQRKCSTNNTLLTCSGKGLWDLSKPCGSDATCDLSVVDGCRVCQEGAKRCESDTVAQTCINGTWKVVETCQTKNQCVDGECKCIPGTFHCSGTYGIVNFCPNSRKLDPISCRRANLGADRILYGACNSCGFRHCNETNTLRCNGLYRMEQCRSNSWELVDNCQRRNVTEHCTKLLQSYPGATGTVKASMEILLNICKANKQLPEYCDTKARGCVVGECSMTQVDLPCLNPKVAQKCELLPNGWTIKTFQYCNNHIDNFIAGDFTNLGTFCLEGPFRTSTCAPGDRELKLSDPHKGQGIINTFEAWRRTMDGMTIMYQRGVERENVFLAYQAITTGNLSLLPIDFIRSIDFEAYHKVYLNAYVTDLGPIIEETRSSVVVRRSVFSMSFIEFTLTLAEYIKPVVDFALQMFVGFLGAESLQDFLLGLVLSLLSAGLLKLLKVGVTAARVSWATARAADIAKIEKGLRYIDNLASLKYGL